MFNKISIDSVALGALSVGGYLRFLRPRQLRWRANDAKVARAMRGDDVVQQPTFDATRAVTIQARSLRDPWSRRQPPTGASR